MHPVAFAYAIPLDETIWASADRTVSNWRGQPGNDTTLLFEYVDDVDGISDTTYVNLDAFILNSSRTLAFYMTAPTGDPSPTQNVNLQVRCLYEDNGFQPLPTAPELTIRLDESGTQRAQGSATSLTQSFADYSLFLSAAQINSVGNWDNVEVEMFFDNTMNTDPDEEAQFKCSECRIIFSP